MPAPRRHRLPQRLDWNLIPPPLDLSKPLVDEKALLPAIIVTPSSPTGVRDFSIAFLADEKAQSAVPESPSARLHATLKRAAKAPSQWSPRTLLLIFVPLFLLLLHALAHGIAARRPRLHFVQPAASSLQHANDQGNVGWFDLGDYHRPRHADFVVIAEPESKVAALE